MTDDVACRNTVHELPVGLTSLYIRIPKTPRTEPGKNDLHYCQRTTASGDCRLRPAGAERSRFGNGTSGWTVRLYVSKGARPIAFTTSSLGSWAFSFRALSRPPISLSVALCARKTPLHPERYYPHARIRVFHHSGPEIPGSAREGKPRSFFLCF